MVVKQALLGYSDPPASPPLPSPGPPRAVEYTFDRGIEGWSFNTYDDPNLTNLSLRVAPGGSPPALSFQPADGDPGGSPGSLQVTAPFTAFDQYVDAIVGYAQPGLDLSGKSLHVMVKLVSGTLGGLQFHASSGASYLYAAAPFVDSLPLGQWVPLTLDLGTVTTAGYDAKQIVQLGVTVFSGFSAGGGTFPGGGDTILEIDTVTD